MNEKKMRILFIIDSLAGGGKERRLIQLIKGLNELNFTDLNLISLSDVKDYPIIDTYKIKQQVIKRKIKWDPSMFFKLYEAIKKINPDIVHSWSIMTSFYVSIICKILRIPHVAGFVADCNPVKRFSIYHMAIQFPYKFADAIIGNSNAGLIAYTVPQKKRKVIYNGFEMKRLEISQKTSDLRKSLNINTPFVVTMAARFEKMKDFQTFFDAAKKMISYRNDITFLAIGKGELYEEFESKIEKKNKYYLRMIGFRNDIDSIIKMSDIGVLCTNPAFHAEGISNSLMEFMAFGKPVISTKGGGTAEIITDSINGFIIEPENSIELASKIDTLLNDPFLISTIGENARITIQTKFSLNKMTDAYLKLYKNYV